MNAIDDSGLSQGSGAQPESVPGLPDGVLAYTGQQLCAAMQIDKVTLWRLEKRNLIRRVPGIGLRRYSVKEVHRFLNAA